MGIKFEAGSGSVLLYARRLYLVVTCCFGQFNFLVIISCAFSHKVNESLHVLILLKLSYLTSLRTKSFTKKLDDTRDEKIRGGKNGILIHLFYQVEAIG